MIVRDCWYRLLKKHTADDKIPTKQKEPVDAHSSKNFGLGPDDLRTKASGRVDDEEPQDVVEQCGTSVMPGTSHHGPLDLTNVLNTHHGLLQFNRNSFPHDVPSFLFWKAQKSKLEVGKRPDLRHENAEGVSVVGDDGDRNAERSVPAREEQGARNTSFALAHGARAVLDARTWSPRAASGPSGEKAREPVRTASAPDTRKIGGSQRPERF